MNKISVTYFGMDGTGRTVTEARQDAGRKIVSALSGSYTPSIMAWRGWAILIYRDPDGWHPTIIVTPEGIRTDTLCCVSGRDRESAFSSARANLAQLGWTPDDGGVPPPWLVDRREVDDYRHWVQFQLTYRRFREQGYSDHDCHSLACGMSLEQVRANA